MQWLGYYLAYKGLTQGGTAAVDQLQLLQPLLGLALAATLVHKEISIGMILATKSVILCIAGTKKIVKVKSQISEDEDTWMKKEF